MWYYYWVRDESRHLHWALTVAQVDCGLQQGGHTHASAASNNSCPNEGTYLTFATTDNQRKLHGVPGAHTFQTPRLLHPAP